MKPSVSLCDLKTHSASLLPVQLHLVGGGGAQEDGGVAEVLLQGRVGEGEIARVGGAGGKRRTFQVGDLLDDGLGQGLGLAVLHGQEGDDGARAEGGGLGGGALGKGLAEGVGQGS